MSPKFDNEYDICLQNLEKARIYFGIQMQEIDRFAELGINAYSRIISRKQKIKLNELITICNKIYGGKAIEFLNPYMSVPNLSSLPIQIAEIVEVRKNKKPREQKKREIIQYCIIILAKHFNPGDEFTNTQIKEYLNKNLQLHFNRKSIEWKKSIISSYIIETKKRKKAKTKSEIVYKLKKAIPTEIVNNAKKAIKEI